MDDSNQRPVGEKIKSPCQDFCPISLPCHGYVSMMREGNFEQAHRLIRQRLPLPLSLGRVCDAPCQKACRRAQRDKTVAIRHLKRFAAEYARTCRLDYSPEIKAPRAEKMAIIGAGPAGLAAAYDLAREGFSVTVFEKLPVAGGMLAVGAPEFRLPFEILESEIENILKLGVTLMLNTAVDDARALLHQGFSAVFIATGRSRGKRLNIQGAALPGVWTGVDFLTASNLKIKKIADSGFSPGKHLLVLGSGGVAIDCARTALRLGARVSVACLESRGLMPAEADEIAAAEEEGVVIFPSRSFTRILGKAGRTTGVEAVRVTDLVFDHAGIPHFQEVPGTEHKLDADTVIFAVGQDTDPKGVTAPLKPGDNGLAEINFHTCETGIAGIFAGGDCARNLGSVVQAIADGQRAALSIIAYANGGTPSIDQQRRDDEFIALPGAIPSEEEIAHSPSVPLRTIGIDARKTSFAEVILPYTEQDAVREASRCLRCDLLKPADAIRPEGFGVVGDLDSNIAKILDDGTPVSKSFLRRAILHALGIKPKRKQSENVIIFGCMYAFGMAKQMLASVKLLDYLGVDYTFLREKEMCCGLPLVEWMGGKKAEDAAGSFIQWNVSEAKKLGANRVIYLCQWCVYLAKHHLRAEKTPQVYFLDFIAEHLLREKMMLPPARVGYYEGCHIRRLDFSPGVELDWALYRRLLEQIQGIEIVDLPHWRCCVTDAERIVDQAIEKRIDYLVCSCAACWTWIERVSIKKSLKTKMLQDLILEAMSVSIL